MTSHRACTALPMLLACLLMGSQPTIDIPSDPSPPASQLAATQPADRIAPFQPGLRINWTRRQVEAEATVILREGLIELFACSPGIREHEAIVRMEARPLHLFQALGLVGLTPGHPAYFDEKLQRSIPASGDPVDIRVRYRENGREKTVPIEQWMLQARGQTPVPPQHWVFAGSRKLEDNVYAADTEGTVIALVDFSSAIIALPELHTDSNEQLWLVPNTPSIPQTNTSCTLLFTCGPMRLRLVRENILLLNHAALTRQAFIRHLRANRALWSTREWVIETDSDTGAARVTSLTSLLKDAGIGNVRITVKQEHSRTQPATASSPADATTGIGEDVQ